jgi:heat shock protein HslJ
MNRFLKFSILLIGLLVLAGCSNVSAAPESTPTPEAAVGLAGTNWVLSGLNGDLPLPDTTVTLQFDSDGNVTGTDGCNQFNTTFVQDGSSLTIAQPAATTMMACQADVMAQASTYMQTLARTTSFSASPRQLVLQQGNQIIATFVATSQELAGTSWEVISYNNGRDAVVSLLTGSEIDADFGTDATVSGSAGCNNYFAGFAAADGTIEIDMPGSTMRMCDEPPGIMEQEIEFLAALTSAATYNIQGNLLEMRTADDQIALILTRKLMVDLPEPEPNLPWGRVSSANGLNVRSGPGVNFPVIGTAANNDEGEIIGRSADNRWWAVAVPTTPGGIGWVSTDFVIAINVENVPVLEAPAPPPVQPPPVQPPATPTARPPATATPVTEISFSADQTTIDQGQCTVLRWSATNAEAIWINPSTDLFDRTPRPSQGSQQVCPSVTTTYQMRVSQRNGAIDLREVTITVRPSATPEAQISFWADRTTINQGECTRIYWHVENVEGVWVYPQGERFDRFPRTGQDSERVCPNSTTTYEMRVLMRDGSIVFRQVTINVNQVATATPVPPTATAVPPTAVPPTATPAPVSNPLAGTSWSAVQINTGAGISTLLEGTSATASFSADGQVSGNAGCNTFNAGYQVNGNALSINQPSSTSALCPDPEGLMEQEFQFLNALQSAATFTLEGNTLTILNASGQIAAILSR